MMGVLYMFFKMPIAFSVVPRHGFFSYLLLFSLLFSPIFRLFTTNTLQYYCITFYNIYTKCFFFKCCIWCMSKIWFFFQYLYQSFSFISVFCFIYFIFHCFCSLVFIWDQIQKLIFFWQTFYINYVEITLVYFMGRFYFNFLFSVHLYKVNLKNNSANDLWESIPVTIVSQFSGLSCFLKVQLVIDD